MFDGIFDIKNDQRLSTYLYRSGFVLWLTYVVLIAPALHAYVHYRIETGIAAALFIVAGFFTSMVFDFYHQPGLFRAKRLMVAFYFVFGAIFLIWSQFQ